MQHQFFSKMWLTLSQNQKTELIKIIVGKALFHMKILIQSMLCKNLKMEFFFQKKNSLAHLKDSLLIKKTMIIQKNYLFYLK